MGQDSLDGVDALLAGLDAQLPPPSERRRLRRSVRPRIGQAEVARVCGVTRETVSAWESGRWEPAGATRTTYRRLLDGLRERLDGAAVPAPAAPASAPKGSQPTLQPPAWAPAVPAAPARAALGPAPDLDDQGELLRGELEPCIMCGARTPLRSGGLPQHLYAACMTAAALPPATVETSSATAAAESAASTRPTPPPAPEPEPEPSPAASARRPRPEAAPERPVRQYQDEVEAIAEMARKALQDHGGDVEAAAGYLVRRAIPDGMALLDRCRSQGRYEHTAYPPLPDLLQRRSKKEPDQIWEGRPKWKRATLPEGQHRVTVLDTNAAYLNALKTWLPIGQLQHRQGPLDPGELDDRKANGRTLHRSGIYRITPPQWEHHDLPNPLGARETPGPLWVTDPTLRLILRASTPKYGPLCEPPVIHESWTSGASESILDKFRDVLSKARMNAIESGDILVTEYVKAMYSKVVSTMGQSADNRVIRRPDWMHIIRSQAFANLWLRGFKAYSRGLQVVAVTGTDELHLTGGDWRTVFTEGRGLADMKAKPDAAYELEA